MDSFVIGGAQLGPIQQADSRASVVKRMIDLLRQAHERSVDFLVYPELALTTFFPRWYVEDRSEMDRWFERRMPSVETIPLFEEARKRGIAITFGYAELTDDGRHFNTSILTDRAGEIVGKYRKIHIPGHVELRPECNHQHLEKRYFLPGDLGFNVWRNAGMIMGMAICNDRRWSETYRVLGLKGVELVTIGYNTPSVHPLDPTVTAAQRMFHSELVMQAGAYQNATFVVGIAKCGTEDGHHLLGGSVIINPLGEVIARAGSEGDELIVATADLSLCKEGKATVFDFNAHRRIEHYGLIASQTGTICPD